MVLGTLEHVLAGDRGHARDLAAGGAFTCDFGLPAEIAFDQVPQILERDRSLMAARPGFIRKYVPLRIGPFDGAISSGGRYLFATREHADAYRDWVSDEFVLDGVLFLQRPYFLAPDCRSWSVIGAHDFSDTARHVVVRTERWRVPEENQRRLLIERWPLVRDAAAAQGLASVWLLYDRHEGVVSLVSVANRVAPPDPSVPDFPSLLALELNPSAGVIFDDQPWPRIFDRTSWVLTTWFSADSGAPSLWPNSPPFPKP